MKRYLVGRALGIGLLAGGGSGAIAQVSIKKIDPVQASIQSPRQAGANVLMRGEKFVVVGKPFSADPSKNKIRLIQKMSVRSTGGTAGGGRATATTGRVTPPAGRERIVETLYAERVAAGLSHRLEPLLPFDVRNGRYELELEVVGVGKAARIPILVVDPVVKSTSCSTPDRVGGTIAFTLNHAPTGARIVVQRLANAPFPEVYWSTYNSVGSSSALIVPTIANASFGGGKVASGRLPTPLGAGRFRARVQGGGGATAWTNFEIQPPAQRKAVYTVRFEGLRCEVETDEVGADEPYTIFMAGTFGGSMNGKRGPLHSDVDQGEFHPGTVTIVANREIERLEELLIAVALVENDDSVAGGIQGDTIQNCREAPALYRARPADRPAAVAGYLGRMKSMIDNATWDHYTRLGKENRDDIVGAIELDLSGAFLAQCRKTAGWHRIERTISGDGGRYRLRFSVKADPKPN